MFQLNDEHMPTMKYNFCKTDIRGAYATSYRFRDHIL